MKLKHIPYLFTKNDLRDSFSSKKQYDNWLHVSMKNGKIRKVRNGLYVSLDQMGSISSTKFEIASKINGDSYLYAHAALDYYGLANQCFNELTIASKSRFASFEFDGVTYRYCKNDNYEQVIYDEASGVRVTSLERSVIDCFKDLDKAGGIEEVLNALELIPCRLDERKLMDALKSYDQVFLYQKAGYILERFQSKFSLTAGFYDECQSHLTNQIKYFLEGEYQKIGYNAKWRLMAPIDLLSRIDEGYSSLRL